MIVKARMTVEMEVRPVTDYEMEMFGMFMNGATHALVHKDLVISWLKNAEETIVYEAVKSYVGDSIEDYGMSLDVQLIP